jgi:hypothetical protein
MKNHRLLAVALAWAIAAATVVPASAAAEAHETGWRQAETEHFLFIFEPRDRAAVDELLTFCEEVYGQVTGVFHVFPRKVPCVVRGRVDTAHHLFDNPHCPPYYPGLGVSVRADGAWKRA